MAINGGRALLNDFTATCIYFLIHYFLNYSIVSGILHHPTSSSNDSSIKSQDFSLEPGMKESER